MKTLRKLINSLQPSKFDEDGNEYKLTFVCGIESDTDEKVKEVWCAGYMSFGEVNAWLTVGYGSTLFKAILHLKKLIKIKDE